MKIDHIMLVLQSIKNENTENISKNNVEIAKLEKSINKLENEIRKLDRYENKYNRIENIKRSMLKTIKILLILGEIPVIIVLILLMVCLAESINLCLVLASICSLFSFDIIYTYFKEVSPVEDEDKTPFKKWKNFFKVLLQNKETIKNMLIETKENKRVFTEELEQKERKRDSLLSVNSQMNEENYYIDGNEIGLNILVNKYQINDISDNIEVVDFVNKKLERRAK